MLVLYVAVEYLRPQDWLPGLSTAPVGIAAAALLAPFAAARWRPGLSSDPIVWCLAALAAFAALWTPFATNNFWAFETFKILTLYLLVIVAMIGMVDTPARLRKLLGLLGVAFVVQALWAFSHGGRGLTTHFGDENDLALGMNVALPFAVFGFAAARRTAVRLLLGAAAALFVAGVVASASRGGLVTLVITAGAMMLMSRHRAWALLLGAAAAVLLSGVVSAAYWSDMQTMFDSRDATREERIRHWEQAWTVWKEHPVLGVGPGNIPWVVGEYEAYDDRTSRSLAGRSVHSMYFTALPEFGLLGSAVYLALMLAGARRCRTALRAAQERPGAAWIDPWTRAVVCSGVACLAGGLFLSVLYYPHLYYLLGLSAVLASAAQEAEEGAPDASLAKDRRAEIRAAIGARRGAVPLRIPGGPGGARDWATGLERSP